MAKADDINTEADNNSDQHPNLAMIANLAASATAKTLNLNEPDNDEDLNILFHLYHEEGFGLIHDDMSEIIKSLKKYNYISGDPKI